MKVVFGGENRSQLWNNAYDIPPWTTHLALKAVYTVILQVQHQPLLSHTPLNTPDAWHVCVYGNNPRNCNLKAQAFFIQYITNLKQKRPNLLTNQPWTLHLTGVLFNQGGNKETRQACHTRQLVTNREHFTMQVYSSIKEATKRPDKPVTQGSYPQFPVFLASIFFFAYCKHWRRKKPGNEYDESYTTGLLHKQANLLAHLLLKPNQIKRKKKLGYSYTWSPEFLDMLTLSGLMWVARVKV